MGDNTTEYLRESDKGLWYKHKILEVRKYSGLSQDSFAEKLGVSGSAIGLIEQGKTKSPSADLLVALTRKLGVSLDWLLLGEGQMLRSNTQTAQAVRQDSPATVSNVHLRHIAVQYPDKFYRDRLLKGKTSFEAYKQGLPSKSALQEFASHFDTTVEEVAASLPPSKKKVPVQYEIPAFISRLKEWGALVIPLEQQTAHIKQAVEQKAHIAKVQRDYACFEVTAGSWVACKLLASSLDAALDSLCTVVTHTAISTMYVRPGSSKSPGDIQVYSEGAPPEYLLAEEVLQIWACEMLLTSQI